MSRISGRSKDRFLSLETALPEVAWVRRFDNPFPDHSEFQVAMLEGLRLAGLGYRLYKYINKETQNGRLPIMNPFKKSPAGPRFGVPLGGIGAGTINRGWRGDFGRWYLLQGFPSYTTVEADQFAVSIGSRTSSGVPSASVMTTSLPQANKSLKNAWEYRLDPSKVTYHALFPRSWTDFNRDLDPFIRLVCRQVTPVIPHNYKESSYPVGVFEWEVENSDIQPREISIMMTWVNGTGDQNDLAGGHTNRVFHLKGENSSRGRVVGIRLNHEGLTHENVIKEMQMQVADKMKENVSKKLLSSKRDKKDKEKGSRIGKAASRPDLQRFDSKASNKLSFAIGVMPEDDMGVTYCTRFSTTSEIELARLWGSFNSRGELRDSENSDRPSKSGESIGAALCVKFTVEPGKRRKVPFCLAWDMPIVRMYSGRGYYRRYTKFYGRSGDVVQRICQDGLWRYRDWERQIEKWQQPILWDLSLPIWYKQALFNELYYITEGGTVWTDGEEGSPESVVPLDQEDFDTIGKFGYLESMEYIMVNTYDVHFYASWALAMLWPKLDLSLQTDFGISCLEEYDITWKTLHSSHSAKRKVRAAVPHDLGNPGDDPWYLVNSYNIQPINDWKDLNSKFVLQVFRDFTLTKNVRFLQVNYLAIQECLKRLEKFDRDEDGLIENDGFPDQTYDTWAATGASAYSGGLWVAALSAASEISKVLNYRPQQQKFEQMANKARAAYKQKLWTGKYYKYDTSTNPQHDSIMADMLAGQWYARACGLPPLDFEEENLRSALRTIFEFNVKKYKNGQIGAVNGMRPDGKVDKCCLQSVEVWTGTTYGLASCMLQEGLIAEGLETAKGIVMTTYEDVGYHFQTPEAWDSEKHYRAIGYMRPLAIWGMQYAWEHGASSYASGSSRGPLAGVQGLLAHKSAPNRPDPVTLVVPGAARSSDGTSRLRAATTSSVSSGGPPPPMFQRRAPSPSPSPSPTTSSPSFPPPELPGGRGARRSLSPQPLPQIPRSGSAVPLPTRSGTAAPIARSGSAIPLPKRTTSPVPPVPQRPRSPLPPTPGTVSPGTVSPGTSPSPTHMTNPRPSPSPTHLTNPRGPAPPPPGISVEKPSSPKHLEAGGSFEHAGLSPNARSARAGAPPPSFVFTPVPPPKK